VATTLVIGGRPLPWRLGITHQSARFWPLSWDVVFASAARIWRKWGRQRHRIESFKFPLDPELEAIRDVVRSPSAPG
jgi:hypothetical protein